MSNSMGVDRDGRVSGMPKSLILIALVLLTGHACSTDNVYVRQALSDREGTVLVEFSRRQATGVYRRATSRHSFGWTDATEVLVEGFSTPELNGNTDFTWAIARHAKIRMWILDKDSDWLHLSIRPFVVNVDVPQVVSVGVNETNLGTATLTSAGFSDYSLRLPTDVLKLGENVVTFDFVYAEMPRRVSESSPDTRTLAAAFDYIEITSNPRPAFEAARTPQALERSWIMSPDTMMLPSESEARFSIRVPVDGAIEFELERFLNDSPDTIRERYWSACLIVVRLMMS